MTKILIADDHRLFNDGLSFTLNCLYKIVGQVFHGHEVIPSIVDFRPDLVILDINLPGKQGLELGKIIRTDFPHILLLFISMYKESNFVKAARDLDAHGYMLKDSSGAEILDAIGKIIMGQKVFDPKIANLELNLHQQDDFVREHSLSKREVEIIKHLKEGFTTNEIADKLFVSYETVKSHKKNIYFKLNISKLSDLVQFAVEKGI